MTTIVERTFQTTCGSLVHIVLSKASGIYAVDSIETYNCNAITHCGAIFEGHGACVRSPFEEVKTLFEEEPELVVCEIRKKQYPNGYNLTHLLISHKNQHNGQCIVALRARQLRPEWHIDIFTKALLAKFSGIYCDQHTVETIQASQELAGDYVNALAPYNNIELAFK